MFSLGSLLVHLSYRRVAAGGMFVALPLAWALAQQPAAEEKSGNVTSPKTEAPAAQALPAESKPDEAKPSIQSNWVLVPELSDEFNGENLDTKRWHLHNPEWAGRKPGFFSPKNVSLKEGKLQLVTKAENVKEMPEGYKDFTCACLKSRHRIRYGTFEVRAKPAKTRASSSFWLYHNTPQTWTELDVFEISGGHPQLKRTIHTNAHVMRAPTVREKLDTGEKWTWEKDLADDFHTYTFVWDAEFLRWFFDGKLIRISKNEHWHQALHIVLDMEIMTEWFGTPDKDELPATFEVDYFRVWQKQAPKNS